MAASAASLLFAALRWDGSDYRVEGCELADALTGGIGGFLLFGGNATAARERVRELQGRARRPLLFAADLERGAGQQFSGCTALPPASALASLGDPEVLRRAGEVTAREAGAIGVSWILAPVADLDNERANPIVGTRAFGEDAAAVASAVSSWIRGCSAGGGLACAKHFPGHGRTTGDSHRELPVDPAPPATVRRELGPFEAAIAAAVPSVMTAHVAFPALDASRRPATRSRPIVHDLLRRELGFHGVVASDALVMEGATGGVGEGRAAVEAVGAGVDVLLYPRDVERVVAALEDGVSGGALDPGALDAATSRLEGMRRRLEPTGSETSNRDPRASAAGERATAAGAAPTRPDASGRDRRPGEAVPDAGAAGAGEKDLRWADDVARRSLVWARRPRGEPGAFVRPGRVAVTIVDDDRGGPYAPPPREAFARALLEAGFELAPDAEAAETHLITVYSDPRGWKGRAGLSAAARDALAASSTGPSELIVLFGHPRLVGEIAGPAPVLCAWGGEPIMQRAAGATLGALAVGRRAVARAWRDPTASTRREPLGPGTAP